MERSALRSPLAWTLLAINLVALAAVGVISWSSVNPGKSHFTLTPVAFASLPGWQDGDVRPALQAFRRSCAVIAKLPPATPMGRGGYAGTASSWHAACASIPTDNAYATGTREAARAYFESRFVPVEVSGGSGGHFTGYYEPELAVNWQRTARFRVPIYGRPSDLLSADLGDFHTALAGQHIEGRLAGTRFVPYWSRAEIDAAGLPTAPVLVYADDPVSVFFMQIQGSGRARFPDGSIARLDFAAVSGRPYTAIGRVLITKGALTKEGLSLQRIRAWLARHPGQAQAIMESDQSFVFFSLSRLGDPALGSQGSEGVPLTPGASLAVDARFHPLGAPVYIDTTAPRIPSGDRPFARLLIAQDVGGAILGPRRGDVFFGSGADAESIAGRMNAYGQFYVLLPKDVAAALSPSKEIPDILP